MNPNVVDSRSAVWTPTLGAWPTPEGVRFRVWAPKRKSVELCWKRPDVQRSIPLLPEKDGMFSAIVPGMRAGDLYNYCLDGEGPFPDPASRFQPQGVHGPSMVVDPQAYTWSDSAWAGITAERLALYELHVGTFTREGTFRAAAQKLPAVAELGITTVELMPVADFPGERNWGYDGVALYAPARCYGTPDDLRFFVDEAHRLGLGVWMDVVYNHLGPDGNYTGAFSPYYFTHRHRSPWGDGVNFDGPHNAPVRRFFMENALHWIHEYHMDGLRLDATHAIIDESHPPFVQELARHVHAALPSHPVYVVAEDHRNWDVMIKPEAQGGWNLDGVWADDFHHVARRFLAGDHESYYQDFKGTIAELVATIEQGWLFRGEYSRHLKGPRGSNPDGIPYERFVIFIQNHDQVGNRAVGDRLHHQIDPAAYRAISALWLACPETPMVFMGQEWACTSPFLFFTDHPAELGAKVTEGRRQEFKTFSAFSDAKTRAAIPDPQALSTFQQSQLKWDERDQPVHAGVERLYHDLLKRRQEEPALLDHDRSRLFVQAFNEEAFWMLRGGEQPLLVLTRLRGSGDVVLPLDKNEALQGFQWSKHFDTEDAAYAAPAQPPALEISPAAITVRFRRPGTLLLKGRRHG
jgi:maltooligosyltrehalose trehalohydrolase